MSTLAPEQTTEVDFACPSFTSVKLSFQAMPQQEKAASKRQLVFPNGSHSSSWEESLLRLAKSWTRAPAVGQDTILWSQNGSAAVNCNLSSQQLTSATLILTNALEGFYCTFFSWRFQHSPWFLSALKPSSFPSMLLWSCPRDTLMLEFLWKIRFEQLSCKEKKCIPGTDPAFCSTKFKAFLQEV